MPTKIIRKFENTKLTFKDAQIRAIIGDNDDKCKRFISKLWEHHQKEIERKPVRERVSYFSLIKDGIQFKQYVGVFRVDDITVEILPKLDKLTDDNEETSWQNLLYKMVRKSTGLKGHLTGFAPIKHQNDNFLDHYISHFLKEVDYLLRTGLIKKYHQKEGNITALKGRLNFSKQISKNLIHKERFYVNYSTYDQDNMFNQIIYKALQVAKRINNNSRLYSSIEGLLINFPQVKNIAINETMFNKIAYDRKATGYKNAITLAKFILLQLHPDLKNGKSETLAVIFDMNKLYEKYIAIRLREELNKKFQGKYKVEPQDTIDFWKYSKINKRYRQVKPDLVVLNNNQTDSVFDTKWKKPEVKAFPDIADLRQMFAYNQYYFLENQIKPNTAINKLILEKETKLKQVPNAKNKLELENDLNNLYRAINVKFSALVYPYNEILESTDLPIKGDKQWYKRFIEYGNYKNADTFGFCDVIYLPLRLDKDKQLDVVLDPLVEYVIELKRNEQLVMIK
jgi:5-methylcytosine-specific restriction enzyme subunit McrC